ncbi:NAD(P)H-dependent oxidoreductase [Nodosilinea sp. LEGE 07298]|uniref:FMN-dependent NADH-azoreductase n=1 Tax=Nodosilinea sp. LEGE 07298 TaxID=2777970 RepID=UPI00188192CE|nr:NAD(P)H-dependent oxidoreductase [Nodosilinea sp. LEGE 07298]MBE9108202.1 NAD(P)H-dependent oxidoreductase [Nodosilinea sp. LEGE 07298]
MKLLEIQTSVRQDRSVTRTLASKFIYQWQAYHPKAQHYLRDLGAQPPALITNDWVAANLTPASDQTDETRALLATSDTLIAELFASDRLVLGVPMYNFGIPAHLKAYFDQIIRVGHTVDYNRDTQTFEGRLTDKKAIIISSRAGKYTPETPESAMDFCVPYLQFILSFLGIQDVEYVEVPYQGMGDDQQQKATEASIARLMELAKTW